MNHPKLLSNWHWHAGNAVCPCAHLVLPKRNTYPAPESRLQFRTFQSVFRLFASLIWKTSRNSRFCRSDLSTAAAAVKNLSESRPCWSTKSAFTQPPALPFQRSLLFNFVLKELEKYRLYFPGKATRARFERVSRISSHYLMPVHGRAFEDWNTTKSFAADFAYICSEQWLSSKCFFKDFSSQSQGVEVVFCK